jgi:hypothetical protein
MYMNIRIWICKYTYVHICLFTFIYAGLGNESNLNKYGWILVILMAVYILFVMLSGGLIFWIGIDFSALELI